MKDILLDKFLIRNTTNKISRGILTNEFLKSDFFINLLLKKDWKHNDRFYIKKENIIKLCDDMIEEMINQPTLVRLRVPIKIYGDLHGRYGGYIFIKIC